MPETRFGTGRSWWLVVGHPRWTPRGRTDTQVDVAKLLGVAERQVRNIESLLELPQAAQDAIDDPSNGFGMTLALTLKETHQQVSRPLP